MLLKVCGLRENDNVKAVADLTPDLMGFIFAPGSPRYFLDTEKEADIWNIHGRIGKVGVFVNESAENILKLWEEYVFDFIQLHGDESVEFCKRLSDEGVHLIKAFRVNDDFDFSVTEAYSPYVWHFLFDTAGKAPGGNGIQFNWEILKNKRFANKFFLSGGIGPEDAAKIKAFKHPDLLGIDINSKFETAPGVKNVEAIKLFQQQIG